MWNNRVSVLQGATGRRGRRLRSRGTAPPLARAPFREKRVASKMPKRTRPYRESLLEDLQDATEASQYLNAALEDSEEMFLVALRDVAEARQMAKVAESAGVARESVYRMLTTTGNPTYKLSRKSTRLNS